MNGKSKCRILKDIRRRIAEDNDIAYITSECSFQGECSGTCPKCEAELQYLEKELQKRQAAGKAIAVAGIAATLLLNTTGCASSQDGHDDNSGNYGQHQELQGAPIAPPPTEEPMGEPTIAPTEELLGYITAPTEYDVMGMMLPPNADY